MIRNSFVTHTRCRTFFQKRATEIHKLRYHPLYPITTANTASSWEPYEASWGLFLIIIIMYVSVGRWRFKLPVMNNSTEAATNEVYEPIELPEYIAWTSLVLCSIILAVGILGNLLVIIVILTSKALRSSTNLFLLNLSIADLLVLATCTPTSLVEIVTRRDAWILGKVCDVFSVPLN